MSFLAQKTWHPYADVYASVRSVFMKGAPESGKAHRTDCTLLVKEPWMMMVVKTDWVGLHWSGIYGYLWKSFANVSISPGDLRSCCVLESIKRQWKAHVYMWCTKDVCKVGWVFPYSPLQANVLNVEEWNKSELNTITKRKRKLQPN